MSVILAAAPKQFRLKCEKLHLTYKTHIDMGTTMAMFERFGAMKMWSFVHELGDEEEDNPTPYEHTHVFVWYVKSLDIRNSRAFDESYEWRDS